MSSTVKHALVAAVVGLALLAAINRVKALEQVKKLINGA